MRDSFEFKGKASDVLKLSKTSFTVNYADGEKKEVEEGILFAVDPEDGHFIFHNGTDRAEVVFTAVIALYEVIDRFGLDDAFDRWFEKNYGKEAER